jgi:sirohydrochlorin cobaltochelatase
MTAYEVQQTKETSSVVQVSTSDQMMSVPSPSDEAIVLMAHGSRDVEGADEFLTFVGRLSSRLALPVYPGFLELSDPPVVSAIDKAVQAGARTIVAVPWLLLAAGHVKNDLPTAVQWARHRYPQVVIRYGTPINVQPELLSVLGERLAAVDPGNGIGSPETAVLLVQRGSSDPEANAEVYRAARLLWEGRNYGTIEVAFSGITRPSISEGLQRCLVLGARRVLVVPYFLYTGVLVKRISTIVAEIAATHRACEFRVAQHLGQDNRLDLLAQHMIEQTRNGKATMSCDVCQYRVPLFGRESLVGMRQVSDHAHGLRGTMMSEDTSSMDAGHSHGHYHHDHDHSHASPPHDAWKALRECVTAAGIMDMQEIRDALAAWQSKHKAQIDTPLTPYILTAKSGHTPTAALRWDFDSRRAHEFAAWCMATLRERFGISWQIECEDEDAQLGPHYLRITLGEHQERCDWRYLNQNHWMGAFCTIADRLLEAVGLTALSLETGWFDTVVLFCRSSHAEEILGWFPESE